MGYECDIIVYTDASSAIKFAMKRGVGRMKHMALKHASLQDDIRDKEIVLKYRKSEESVVDFLAKGMKNETFSRDRELAEVVKYEEQTSSNNKVSVTGRKLVAMIVISQFGKVGAVALDDEFIGSC